MKRSQTKFKIALILLVFSVIIITCTCIRHEYLKGTEGCSAEPCGETIYNTKQEGNKFLVMGSAPYMKDWVKDHLQWFVDEGFRILPMNNAHKLIAPSLINEWHKPNDYNEFGSFPILEDECKQMQSVVTHCASNFGYMHLYKRHLGNGTMLFNTLYYLLHKYDNPITVVVVGTDMIYKQQGDTFYSHLPASKAANDPVNKYNDTHIAEELQHIQKLYQETQHSLLNASEQKESRLPFRRFTEHL
jgi:hypothetical protein